MSNYSSLKATINANVKQNGNQEVTGAIMNSVLNAMVDSLGAGYQYKGVATPATNPGTPDYNVFYLASEAGTYTNFGGIVIGDNEVAALVYNGSWSKQTTGAATASEVSQLSQDVNDIYGETTIATKYVFGGTSNVITFDAISLAEEGDAVEFKVKTSLSASSAAGFAFARNGESKIALSLTSAILGIKNASNVWLTDFNASSAKYNFSSHGPGNISSTARVFKLVRGATDLELYIDGNLQRTDTTSPTITIDRIGGVHSSNYWSGEMEYFRYTHNGVTTDLYNLPGYSVTGDVTVTTTTVISGMLSDKVDKVAGKGLSTNDYTDDDKLVVDVAVGLGWGWKFNGVDSYLTLATPIVLSTDGDSVEFDLSVNSDGTGSEPAYPFSYGGRPNGLGIGVSKRALTIISDDATWIYNVNDLANTDAQTIKIEYADGNILVYRNGDLKTTYSGQKTITIKGFGNGANGTYGYWDGAILSMKVDGVAYEPGDGATVYKAVRYRTGGFLTPTQEAALNALLPPVVVSPNTATNFSVLVLNRKTGKYVTHTFHRSQGTRTVDGVEYTSLDVWNADNIVSPDGVSSFQGNLNMIYRIGTVDGVSASSVNENYHIGPGHGCEVMQFFKFFADGKEFTPGVDTDEIPCSTFRAIWKSTCYVVDSSQDTGNSNNYPKIVNGDMVAHAVHYLDATYRADNVIDWDNRLVQVREASVQYAMLCGAMLQGYTSVVDNVMLNDIDNSWNEFASGTSVASFSIPSGYDSENLFGKTKAATVAIMYGDGAIARQSCRNDVNEDLSHARILTTSNSATSAKCYLQPVIPTGLSDTADTFTAGDVIAVHSHREIEFD